MKRWATTSRHDTAPERRTVFLSSRALWYDESLPITDGKNRPRLISFLCCPAPCLMPITAFPPHHHALPSGLLAIGGDLSVESLVLAYTNGIFPWPHDDTEILWFSPPTRTILRFDELHVPRSLRRFLRHSPFKVTMNTAFDEVIDRCSELKNRDDQTGTWITPGMKHAYSELHRAGFCHSLESWREDLLVGGMYGVSIGRFFAGESMFYREPNASKVALLSAIGFLQSRGISWMDCQMTTALTEQLGAKEIGRDEYLALLKEALG